MKSISPYFLFEDQKQLSPMQRFGVAMATFAGIRLGRTLYKKHQENKAKAEIENNTVSNFAKDNLN